MIFDCEKKVYAIPEDELALMFMKMARIINYLEDDSVDDSDGPKVDKSIYTTNHEYIKDLTDSMLDDSRLVEAINKLLTFTLSDDEHESLKGWFPIKIGIEPVVPFIIEEDNNLKDVVKNYTKPVVLPTYISSKRQLKNA